MKSSRPMPRALIADDQLEVLEALRLLLKSEGIQTVAVTSPAAVLEALRNQEFDVLLMDLNYARDTTSGKEGLDLLTELQAWDKTLPVVVMTGWGSVELAVEAMRRGVRDFVQKPWDNDRLVNALRLQIAQGRVIRKGLRFEKAIGHMKAEIAASSDVHALMGKITSCLHEALRLVSVVLFTRAHADQAFWASAQAGDGEDVVGKLKFDSASPLIGGMDRIFDPFVLQLPDDDLQKLRQAKCSTIAPIRHKNEISGFLVLGPKLSVDPLDAEELGFLDVAIREIDSGVETIRTRGRQREFEEAREIQQGLLPKEIPQIPGYHISGGSQPASAVGGDYFDVLRFHGRKTGLCIADVAGKGMPAALLMSNLQAAVKAFASESVSPSELCSKVNRVICSNIAANKFITFFYCLHDAERKRLVYANAGHDAPIVIRRNGSVERLREGGAVLGVFREWNYEQNEIEFSSGDRVIFFTDGVTEVRNSEGEEFGEERLIEFLLGMRACGAGELQQKIMHKVDEYSGGEFQDDATVVVLSAD
jgi:FixJ family two-component response regulator